MTIAYETNRGRTADHAVPGPSVGGTVAQRLDRLPVTWLHVAILVLSALGFAFDLMEVALGNVLSAVFSAPPYSVEPVQLSWLLAAMYVGAIPGAALSGWVADRYGRQIVLFGVLLILAATSTAAAASPNIDFLIVARILSGLALGAYPPLIISYLTDVVPPRRRGLLITMVTALAGLGPVAIIFLVRWLTPIQPVGVEAWRWAFLLGAIGALLIAAAFRLLPESPRWLMSRGWQAEAEAAVAVFERSPVAVHIATVEAAVEPAKAEPVSTAFDRRRFVLVGAIYFLTPWATVAFPLLMGAVLIEKGFQLSDSLFYVGIAMFGPVIGTVLAAFFLDKIERRMALAIFGVGLIIAGVAFASSLNPIWLMTAGVAFNFLAMVYLPTLTIYGAESFPTVYRARAATGAWAINRVASAIAPLVLLPLLRNVGVWAMFSVIIATLVIGAVLVLAFGPRGKAGRAVD